MSKHHFHTFESLPDAEPVYLLKCACGEPMYVPATVVSLYWQHLFKNIPRRQPMWPENREALPETASGLNLLDADQTFRRQMLREVRRTALLDAAKTICTFCDSPKALHLNCPAASIWLLIDELEEEKSNVVRIHT